MDSILKFIEGIRNEGTVRAFTQGYCYWFAFILHERFILSEIDYNPVLNHFALRIGTALYDITGELQDDGKWVDWDEYQQLDPLDAERVYKYCILKIEHYVKEDKE